MADVVIRFEGDDNTAGAFNRIQRELDRLGLEVQDFDEDTISGARTVANQRIAHAQRAFQREARHEQERIRQRLRANLEIIRSTVGLSNEERRIQINTARQTAAENLRTTATILEGHQDRLRSARETIGGIVRAERNLARNRDRDYRTFRTQLSDITRRYRNLFGALTAISGVGLFGVGRFVIGAAVEIDSLRRSIEAVTGSAEAANRAVRGFREAARFPGVTVTSIGNLAQQLANINIDLDRGTQLAIEFGNALALSGRQLTNEFSFNISQIISDLTTEGRAESRDLRQLINQGAIFGRIFGDEAGKISGQAFAAAFRESGLQPVDFLISRLQTAPRADINAAANVFNNFNIAVRELAAQLGELALPALTQQIRQLTEQIRANADRIVQRFTSTIDLLVTAAGRLIMRLTDLGNLLKSALIARATIDATQLFLGLGSNITSMSAAASQAARPGGGTSRLNSLLIRLGPAAAGLATGIGTLTGGIALLASVAAGISLIRLIRGATETADTVENLRTELRLLNIETDRATGTGIFSGSAQPGITRLTTRLSQTVGLLRTVREEIERIESNGVAIDEQTRQIRENLRALRERETAGAAGRGLREDIRLQVERLQRLNTLSNQRTALQEEIARLEKEIAESGQQQVAPKQQIVQLTRDQVNAEVTLFNHRLRLLSLTRRQAQIESQRRSEIDLQSQEAVQARQQAIADNRQQQAVIRSRERISQLRQEAAEELRQDAQSQIDNFRSLARNITNLWQGVNIALVDNTRSAVGNIVNEFNTAAQTFFDLQQRIDAGVARLQESQQRAFDVAGRQPRSQQDLIDELIGANAQDRATRSQNFINQHLRELSQLSVNQAQQVANQQREIQLNLERTLLNSAVDFALEREQTFADAAIAFAKQSVRIIAQSFLEVSILERNNSRLKESYLELAQARALAQGLNIPATFFNPLGAIPTGIPTLIQLTNLLRIGPNEAIPLGDYITQFFREGFTN